MDDWLRNMGDWNISRRRYYGLPLPLYPCACGHLNVIGSKAELIERATEGVEQLEELRRPWIDRVPIRCEACGERVERIPEVGDVWLDAGIVPFSTLGWENPERIPQGYGTGAARGLTTADLPEHAYWEQWFPADWVSEMREQIRLWFYSQLFMSVVLVGRAPYQAGARLREDARREGPRDARLVGQHDRRRGGVRAMGADVMRWQYCAQPPDRDLLFGFGPAGEIKRRLLTFWNSMGSSSTTRTSRASRRRGTRSSPSGELDGARPLARRADAAARGRRHGRVRGDADRGRDPGVRELRRRRLQLVHPAFAPPLLFLDEAAFTRLWYALVQSLRVIAPVVPFLTDHSGGTSCRTGRPPSISPVAGARLARRGAPR